ncbi:MAG: hypothetical protein L6306_10250 [Planctomycetales bacterium]|nr:hypothetical protein [Planctomycetales bacterium]
MIDAKLIFGTKIEQRELDTVPALGAGIRGPADDPRIWKVSGIVTRPGATTLTCQPADAPVYWLRGDTTFPPLQS